MTELEEAIINFYKTDLAQANAFRSRGQKYKMASMCKIAKHFNITTNEATQIVKTYLNTSIGTAND